MPHISDGYNQVPLTEQQWFQIALKTYFWVGFCFATVFAISISCLVATKYYYDQAVLRHSELDRDFRSYAKELAEARDKVREVGKVWYAVDQIRQELEAKKKTEDDTHP